MSRRQLGNPVLDTSKRTEAVGLESGTENGAVKARIAVIGTGALGSTLLQYLVGRDIRSALLIDPDRVEARNLALSQMLRAALHHRAGASPEIAIQSAPYKAQLLADHLTQKHDWNASALMSEIADVGWQDLSDVDAFYCCTDSALSRVETTYIARVLRKPLIDGGVFGEGISQGRVTAFSPCPEAACYLCGMGEESRAAVLGYAASASMGCRVSEEAPAMTGTIVTIQQTARLMSQLPVPFREQCESRALRVSAPMDGAAAKTLTETPAVETIRLTRGATCPWHLGLPEKLEALPWELPLRTTLRSQEPRELQLAWPICTEAHCAACGFRLQPFERVARVRRTACPDCGGGHLQPIRAVHRIRADDPIAGRSPRQLGQPQRHLYWLGKPVDLYGRREGAR